MRHKKNTEEVETKEFQYEDFTKMMDEAENKVFDYSEVIKEEENKVETSSAVNHPSHYNQGTIEVITAIDDWGLNFSLGNVVKYVVRAPYKGNPIEDLEKARFYIDHEIEYLKSLEKAE